MLVLRDHDLGALLAAGDDGADLAVVDPAAFALAYFSCEPAAKRSRRPADGEVAPDIVGGLRHGVRRRIALRPWGFGKRAPIVESKTLTSRP